MIVFPPWQKIFRRKIFHVSLKIKRSLTLNKSSVKSTLLHSVILLSPICSSKNTSSQNTSMVSCSKTSSCPKHERFSAFVRRRTKRLPNLRITNQHHSVKYFIEMVWRAVRTIMIIRTRLTIIHPGLFGLCNNQVVETIYLHEMCRKTKKINQGWSECLKIKGYSFVQHLYPDLILYRSGTSLRYLRVEKFVFRTRAICTQTLQYLWWTVLNSPKQLSSVMKEGTKVLSHSSLQKKWFNWTLDNCVLSIQSVCEFLSSTVIMPKHLCFPKLGGHLELSCYFIRVIRNFQTCPICSLMTISHVRNYLWDLSFSDSCSSIHEQWLKWIVLFFVDPNLQTLAIQLSWSDYFVTFEEVINRWKILHKKWYGVSGLDIISGKFPFGV